MGKVIPFGKRSAAASPRESVKRRKTTLLSEQQRLQSQPVSRLAAVSSFRQAMLKKLLAAGGKITRVGPKLSAIDPNAGTPDSS